MFSNDSVLKEARERHQREMCGCMACEMHDMDEEDKIAKGMTPAAIAVLIPVALAIILLLCCGIKSCHAEEKVDVTIISQMESSGNPFAKNGKHYGLCQIGLAVLSDYNRTHGTIWTMVDLYNGVINLRVAEWYLNVEIPRMLQHFKLADTLDNRLTAWRYGIFSAKNGNMATKYIAKYRSLTWKSQKTTTR